MNLIDKKILCDMQTFNTGCIRRLSINGQTKQRKNQPTSFYLAMIVFPLFNHILFNVKKTEEKDKL